MLKNDKGLTLIEVLGGLIILSIVIVVFMNISGYTSQSFGKTDKKEAAVRLAENTLAEKRNAIAKAESLPDSGSQGVATTVIGGYSVTIYDTILTNTAYALPAGTTVHVSVQAIVLLKKTTSPFDKEPRLITVTVSWEG
ncbi:MAG TPA: prepilin-type N-terminal cleavage/methylation domain-containing protein [Bacilli bacterium]